MGVPKSLILIGCSMIFTDFPSETIYFGPFGVPPFLETPISMYTHPTFHPKKTAVSEDSKCARRSARTAIPTTIASGAIWT